MSYDVLVYAKRQPRAAVLDAFVRSNGLRANGRFARSSSVLVESDAGDAAEIDGPDRITAEDLPAAANGSTGSSGWVVSVSVRGATQAPWPSELAVQLARAADGVVYDPQQDIVTWPHGWRPRDPETRRQVIDVVEVDWFIAGPPGQRTQALRLLEVLSRLYPQALPRRYGDYEPFQNRFEGVAAADEFADFWAAQAASSMGIFFWTATRPCFGATVTMTPPDEESPVKEQALACTRITLTIDARPCFRDPESVETIAGLFEAVAATLGCFYAAASLNRGFVLYGNTGLSGGGESSPVPFGSAWVGLPASPTWLAWFGPPYAPLVRSAVARYTVRDAAAGLLIRLGAEPLDASQLADRHPPLPVRLVARSSERGPGRWRPGGRYTMGARPPSWPAIEIPPLPIPPPDPDESSLSR